MMFLHQSNPTTWADVGLVAVIVLSVLVGHLIRVRCFE